MGYNFGGEKNGFTVSASGSQSKSREKGNGTDWTESVVEAGNKVTIVTGNDANIIAGQVKGEQVTADIGHNLNIESKQDSDQYHQKSSSKSVGGSFSTGGAPTLNASNSQTKMDSNWKSVTDQSGIFAGKGGYDIKVGNNTDLKGAVIASEAVDTSKNKLDTGTISFSDIENKADYKVSSSNMGVNTSGIPTPPNNYNKNDKASSTTHSAVSNGTLIVRNEDEQKQDINTLSRDTEHASKELKHIFNKDKEQSIIDQTQLVSEIGGQTLTMLNNIDKITATAEANKALDKERQKAQSEKTVLTEEEQEKIYKKAYEDAMNNGMSAMGSDTRQGVEMAVSIIKGLIIGDMTGATAGALAPKLASEIKKYTEHKDQVTGENKIDYVSNTVAHAILGAVVAELQGNSALAGGLGAAYGENSARIIAGILYPDEDIDKLSQDKRQQVSALAQLAAGLTTAALGGDAQDINTAMAGGKNAIENNLMNKDPWWTEQDKQEASERINQAFINKNCGGVDDAACTQKKRERVIENLKIIGGLIVDFTPVVGDINAFVEAEDSLDYTIALIGLIPGLGDAVGKSLKEAKAALKIGDAKKANELVQEAQQYVKAGKGTNSVTQADAAKYFGQERKYWSKDPIEFNGNKVYQRNDLFDPNYVDAKGRTNIERMKLGYAPLDKNGQPINLHHMTQRQDGPIAEVTQSFHQQYRDRIHINPNTIPSRINRNQFNKWRSNYWKNRANDFKQ